MKCFSGSCVLMCVFNVPLRENPLPQTGQSHGLELCLQADGKHVVHWWNWLTCVAKVLLYTNVFGHIEHRKGLLPVCKV